MDSTDMLDFIISQMILSYTLNPQNLQNGLNVLFSMT